MPLEPADFTLLYRRHASSLLVFFQRRVCDPEVATDLLADTFAIAIESAAQFRGGGERQRSGWLWQIAQGVLREYERRDDVERRGRRLAGRERRALSDAEIERIEELAGMAQLRDALTRYLAKLPVDQSEAVRLRIVEEMSYQAIADRLDIEIYAVRARVSRGLRTL
ncbi:MAG TPA: sigma-70 family RNA polymerase sigma factor, partial [Solirubrobacterales bacterium]